MLQRLTLPAADFRSLFQLFGPSLGLWRGAEIAVLRSQVYDPPVLDLGCGDGLVTSFVLSQVDFGIDPDRAALSRAEKTGLYRKVIAAGMESCGLPDGSAGTILSNSVLEHIPAIDDVLRASARVLRPGGQFVFTVPTESFSENLLLPSPAYAARRNRRLQHLNLWGPGEWQRRLERAGLRVKSMQPYLHPGWVRAWDALELLQMIYLGRTRLFGRAWRRLPGSFIEWLALRAARIDLSAHPPGGGMLVVAKKESD